MGIHFVCHHCSYALHVKDFQAGKRGKCPGCKGSFRIPIGDASYSSPIEEVAGIASASKADPTLLPAVLANQLDSKWFVRPSSGGQFGPAPGAMLMSWIAESRVTADSLLCREGTAQWLLASDLLPELFDECIAPAVPATTTDAIATNRMIQDFSNQVDLKASATSIATDVPSASAVSVNSATLRSDAIVKKRIQKRKQQLTLVIILALVSLVLFGVLIYVLVSQVGKPPVQAVSMLAASCNPNSSILVSRILNF